MAWKVLKRLQRSNKHPIACARKSTNHRKRDEKNDIYVMMVQNILQNNTKTKQISFMLYITYIFHNIKQTK